MSYEKLFIITIQSNVPKEFFENKSLQHKTDNISGASI